MASDRTALEAIAKAHGKHIGQAARDVGLPPEAILAMISIESAGGVDSVSPAGARGLMQLMPRTAVEVAKELGYRGFADEADLAQQLHDKPGLNILFGAKYFKNKLDEFGGDYSLAAAAYNAGAGRVRQAGGKVPQNDETPTHNRRFLEAMTTLGWDGKTFPSQKPKVDPNRMPSLGETAPPDIWGQRPNRELFGPDQGVMGPTPAARDPRGQQQLANILFGNPVARAADAAITGATGGYVPMTEVSHMLVGAPDGPVGKFAEFGGHTLGFLGGMKGLGLARAGLPGVAGATAFGAASKAGSAKERLVNAATTWAMQAGFTYAPGLAVAAAAKASPAAGEAVARTMASRLGRAAVDTPAMTALGLAQGMPLEDAAISGAAGAAAGAVAQPRRVPWRIPARQTPPAPAPGEIRPEWVGEAAVPEMVPDVVPKSAAEIAAQVAPQAAPAQQRRVPYRYVPPPAEMIRAPLDGPSGPPVREMPEIAPKRPVAAEDFVGESSIIEAPRVGPQATPPPVEAAPVEGTPRRAPYRAPKPIGADRENRPAQQPDTYVGEGTIFGGEPVVSAPAAKGTKAKAPEAPQKGHPYREFEKDFPVFKPYLDFLERKIGWEEFSRELATKPEYRRLPEAVKQSIAAGETKNVSGVPYWLGARPASVIQGIGGGNPKGSPVERATVQFNELADQAMRMAAGDVAMEFDAIPKRHGLSKADEALLPRLLRAEDNGLMSGESGTAYRQRQPEFVNKAENPEALLNAAVESRALSDRVWQAENDLSVAFGKGPVGYQSAYWPSVSRKPSALREPIKRIKYDITPQKEFRGFGRPMKNTPVNVARELTKKGQVTDPDLGFDRGRGEIAAGFSRRLATTPLARVYEETATALDAAGQSGSAGVLRAIGNSTINDIGYGIRGFTQNAFETTPAGMALITNPNRAMKRLFNRVKYPMNFAFLLLTGPQSIAENAKFGKASKGDPLAAGRMVKAIWKGVTDRELAREYRDSWVGQTKSGNWSGGMHEEVGSGTSISAEALRRKGKFELARDKIMNDPGRFGENFVGRVTFAWGQSVADSYGMTKGERAAFLNQLVAKTQGLYSGTMRGETQKDAIANAWFPAQTHSNNAIQNTIEAWNDSYGWNLAGSRREKAAMVSRAAVWTYAFAILSNAVRNARVEDAEDLLDPKFLADVGVDVGASQIPYASPAVLGPMGVGASKGIAMPVDTALQVRDGIKAAIDGDAEKAAETLAKALVSVQLARVIGTERRMNDGTIADTPENKLGGYSFGWSSTDEGKSYVRRMRNIDDPDIPFVNRKEIELTDDQKLAIERAKKKRRRRG